MISYLIAASAWRDLVKKVLYLSAIIGIVVIPTRLSKGDMKRGPRRAVFAYIVLSVFYYGCLRLVIPKLG